MRVATSLAAAFLVAATIAPAKPAEKPAVVSVPGSAEGRLSSGPTVVSPPGPVAPPAIVPVEPEPNGISSVGAPGSSTSCNTNAAMVQQSGCLH